MLLYTHTQELSNPWQADKKQSLDKLFLINRHEMCKCAWIITDPCVRSSPVPVSSEKQASDSCSFLQLSDQMESVYQLETACRAGYTSIHNIVHPFIRLYRAVGTESPSSFTGNGCRIRESEWVKSNTTRMNGSRLAWWLLDNAGGMSFLRDRVKTHTRIHTREHTHTLELRSKFTWSLSNFGAGSSVERAADERSGIHQLLQVDSL